MAAPQKSTPAIQALLELERREMQQPGTMPPELKQRLETYRAQGLVPKISSGSTNLTEAQGKDAAFLGRALASERDFLKSGYQDTPRGNAGTLANTVLPNGITNQFDAPGRQVSEQARKDFVSASLRLESGAAIGKDEFDRQNEIFFPKVGDSPEVIRQKALHRQAVIEGFRVGAGPGAKQIEDKIDALYGTPAAGAAGASPPTLPTSIPPGAPGGGGLSSLTPDAGPDNGSGGGAPVIEPTPTNHPFATDRDKKFAALAQARFNGGANRVELDNLAKQYGYPAYSGDLDTALAYRNKGGKGAQILAPTSGNTDPGLARKVLGTVAASPVGAAVTGLANGVTLGGLDEAGGLVNSAFTGTPVSESIADLNLKKGLIREANPKTFAGGEIGGGLLTSLAGSGAAGIKAAGALAPRALAVDAGIGATYGGLENNDNRVGGAVTGALSSAAGGAAGRGVMNRIAGAISPNVDPNVAFLRDNGVRTTPGQSIGPMASRAEEKLTPLLGVGDLVRNGRQRALGDFNRGYLNDSLSHVGAVLPDGSTGTTSMRYAQNAFNNAYASARSGMQLRVDPTLVTDLQALDSRFAGGDVADDVYKRVQKIYDSQVLRRIKSGPLNGDDYKEMMSKLGGLQDAAKRGQNFELSDALGDLKGTLDAAARRSSPPEAVAALDAADEGYAKFVRAEKAAAMRGSDTGQFTPTQLDSTVQRMDSSVRSKAYLRGDALGQRWAEAGKAILGDKVPDSGTADRIAMSGAALGAGYLTPGSLAGLGGMAAAYAPGSRDVVSSMIAGNRGAGAKTFADAIRDRAYLGTAAASPLALIYDQNQ